MPQLRVLLVEDSEDDALLLLSELKKGGFDVVSERVYTHDAMKKALEEKAWDIVISDYVMPGFGGMDAFKMLQKTSFDIPFILMSGKITEEMAVDALKAGAGDFILKQNLSRLVPAINRELHEAENRQAKKKAEDKFRESEERFRSVAETANDAIIAIKAPDTIYFWNRKAEEMFGYSSTEAIAMKLHKLIVPEKFREKAYEGMQRFFQTGTGPAIGKSLEFTALRKDGSEFPVELSISAMNIRGEWHATGIIRDISERKRLENELKEKLDIVERMNKLMVGRELKMEELRKEIQGLKLKIQELEKTIQDSKLKTQN